MDVGVLLGRFVGVCVDVFVGLGVSELVGPGVAVNFVGVAVAVLVGVLVGVSVGVLVDVSVGTFVAGVMGVLGGFFVPVGVAAGPAWASVSLGNTATAARKPMTSTADQYSLFVLSSRTHDHRYRDCLIAE